MIVIPNMSKPKSCDECPILIAQIVGIYCDDKDGELKRVKITECDTNKYHGHTLGEDYEMMYKDCPIIEIVQCKDCKHRDPEDKKCDCGMFERQGCIFPVDDDYFCKYGERRTETLDERIKRGLEEWKEK